MRAFMQKHAWLCPILSLLMAITFLAAFGFTWWSALFVGFLLGCPLSVLWALIFSREQGSGQQSRPRGRELG